MIVFSATGNTKLIAKSLAKRLDDEAVDLLTRIKNSDYSELHSETPFVICSPIYASELPTFYMEYLRKACAEILLRYFRDGADEKMFIRTYKF